MQSGYVVTGGHFDPNKPLVQGTIDSFEQAVKEYSLLKEAGVDVHLGVLINNIGMVCGDVCQAVSKQECEIPPALVEISMDYDCPKSKIISYRESHLRNRAKARLDRAIRDKNVFVKEHSTGSYLVVDREKGVDVQVSKFVSVDSPRIPLCALIMAEFAFEQQKNASVSRNYWYIGEDNKETILNTFGIKTGPIVAGYLGASIKVENFFKR